jgi:integrase
MSILTELKAKAIKPDCKPLPHGAVTGLVLHPAALNGQGKWVLRYVSPITHKRRNAGLGSYPETSIAQAAKQAIAYRELLNSGQDPLEEKQKSSKKALLALAQSAVDELATPTFAQAAAQLHVDLTPSWKNLKHTQQWINTIEQFALPVLGQLKLAQIQPKHIADVLRPIWLEKAETASRLKQRIHAVMAWGWAHGHCQSNPVDVVQHLLPQQPSKTVRVEHQPAMPWGMIPTFYRQNLIHTKRYDVTQTMMAVLILTAARSGEVRGMTWAEIDWDLAIWTIPSERMKAAVQHRVPLAPVVLSLLETMRGLHDILVFPSPRKEVPLSDMVLTQLLRRLEAPSDSAGRVATAHGFRSSFRDWCSEHQYPRDLAERALAHAVQNKVEAAYHRTDLLEQRRTMMLAWAAFVSGAKT